MTTLKSALGPAALPLASVVAWWHRGPAWRRRAVRLVAPGLARRLDALQNGMTELIGLP